jgi:hypothetical protein
MPGYTFGNFWFDTDRNEVCNKDGQPTNLTPREKQFLLVLLQAQTPVNMVEIEQLLWTSQGTHVEANRNIAVMKSSINKKFGGVDIIGRTDSDSYYVLPPAVYRIHFDRQAIDIPTEIKDFLSHTHYAIAPVGEYLPLYPAYGGLRRDEVEVRYQGEYQPPDDFLELMKRFRPAPPINQLYSFHGWEGEIPSDDELAGKKGRKLIVCMQGGTWHHIHTLTQIRKACQSTTPDSECAEFRKNYLKKLIPISSSSLYHNVNTEVLVITADNQIVIARRKGAVIWAGSWTASLEEQMLRKREKDGLSDTVANKPDLFACAERGARSELGITVISERTRLLSIGIEFGNFTAAFLMLVHAAETFREISTHNWPNATECDEAVALDALPAQTDAIRSVLAMDIYRPDPTTCVSSPRWNSLGDPMTPGTWHPIAKARLDAYLRHLAIIKSI